MQFGSIQLRNGRLRVLRHGHFDESKAAGLTSFPVRDYIDLPDITELGKRSEEVLLRGLETEIADKKYCSWCPYTYLQIVSAKVSNSAGPTHRWLGSEGRTARGSKWKALEMVALSGTRQENKCQVRAIPTARI